MADYQLKHIQRDAEIPTQRAMIKKAIEEDLSEDPFVIAVFYGGSIGSHETDLYSDIDLRIIVAEEEFENYRLKKKERCKKWGNVLFYEDVPYSNYCTAHYDHFVKVDTFYYQLKDVLPSINMSKIEVLFDTSEMLEDVVSKSQQLTFEPTYEDVAFWRTKFFSNLHETYRRAMRGEFYYALHCLDNLRFLMTTAWYMEAGVQPNAFGDWAKIEGNRSKLQTWQLAALGQWNCGRDLEEIMNVVHEIVPEFKKVHQSLCKRVGLDERVEWMEEIVNQIM